MYNNPNTLKIKVLEKEYQAVLNQYEEAQKNYVNSLNESNNSFTIFPASSWMGTTALNESSVSSPEECENMCLSNNNCTGATFNSVKKYCYTRSGLGNILPSQDSDSALLKNSIANLVLIKSLNEKLLSLIKQITNEYNNVQPQLNEEKKYQQQTQEDLNTNYGLLLDEQVELQKKLDQYNDINENNINESLVVKQANYSYIFWFIISIIFVLITFKLLLGIEGNSNPFSFIFWFVISITLILFTLNLSTPTGFSIWSILLLLVVLMKTGQIPSI
jgi:hypothetical protein